ncbi:MAG TPA: cytochrome d ubiquinol oxidase subunit II, partial [Methylomirabilota bacterium]|nr:cytochrome d ubiquinol oxidase subunit II [Methylomirabilota bacterium]
MGDLGVPELVAGITLVALNAYVLLGGADFGGGVWDLLASGPRKRQQRALIAGAIGPIWEANHVWLILVIVLVFTCFPPVFARLAITLHVPLSLMLIGIVLRGSAFTFRSHYGPDHGEEHGEARAEAAGTSQRWGRVFAIASAGTPVLLGLCVGALAAGTLGPPGRGGFYPVFVAPWLTPFGVGVGLLTLALFSLLAAVYLTVEAREPALREDFRRAALAAAVAVFVAAFGTLGLALLGAPLMGRG